MTKYTRDNIYSDMLKRVIVRCDFYEITDIERFIDNPDNKSFLFNYFEKRIPIEQKHCEIFLNSSSEDNNGLFPVSKKTQKKVFHYEGFKLQKIDAVLDISTDFFCLNINCKDDYRGSRIFTELMVGLIIRLKKSEPFTYFKRVGIRKIDIQILNNRNSISDFFNDKFLVGVSWKSPIKKESSTMTEIIKKGAVSFNVIQRVDRTSDNRRRLIYDVDGYITKEYIEKSIKNNKLMKCLDSEIQNAMFDLFISVTSEKFLDKCLLAKEKMSNG